MNDVRNRLFFKSRFLLTWIKKDTKRLQTVRFDSKTILWRWVGLCLLSMMSVHCGKRQSSITWAEALQYQDGELFSIETGQYGFPYLSVQMNGQEIKLAFDTGNMSGLLLSPEVAKQLKLPVVDESNQYDSEGTLVRVSQVYRVQELKAFGGTWNDQQAHEYKSSQDGLIGPGFLRGKRFTLDYANRVMAVSATSLPGGAAQIRLPMLASAEHEGLILVRGAVNGHKVLMELDTGKSRTVVDPELVELLKLPEAVNGYRLDEISIGSHSFSVESAKKLSFKGVSRELSEPIMLSLGSDILSQLVLTVDYSQQIVVLMGQDAIEDYRSELASAAREIIETDSLRISRIDLGDAHIGKNSFSALVRNKTDSALSLSLDLRADPGLWLRKSQAQFLFEFKPQEQKEVAADYQFSKMSSEAWLRVRFGLPVTKNGGVISVENPFFEKKYHVGEGNKAVNYELSHFEKHQTEHFDFYYFKESIAEKNIKSIVEERESAFQSIADLLDVDYVGNVRVFFFPDAESKKQETGHTGDGWAFSNIIVEVYNEETQLDPFHELAHIIAGELGDPPAMFDEGFAVFVSEKLGSDALAYLGNSGKRVDRVMQMYLNEQKLIPLNDLFGFVDIGSEESKPSISYPQSASFVKYLFEDQGVAKFRQLFEKLKRSDSPGVIAENKRVFTEICGKSLSEMEKSWLSKISRIQ